MPDEVASIVLAKLGSGASIDRMSLLSDDRDLATWSLAPVAASRPVEARSRTPCGNPNAVATAQRGCGECHRQYRCQARRPAVSQNLSSASWLPADPFAQITTCRLPSS